MKHDSAPKQAREVPRSVVFLAVPGTQILDVTGPYQVFVRAAEAHVRRHPQEVAPYQVLLASTTPSKIIPTNCGLSLNATDTLRSLRAPIDTLLVAGGTGAESGSPDKLLLAWLKRNAKRVRRLGSICTGAFILASAGLLDGKRTATHWRWAKELACRFSKVEVDPEPIFIRDGNTYTSAGVLAGMDLALAMVKEDLGSPIALEVARELVMFLRRPGGQAQFSTALALQSSDREQIDELCSWAADHLTADLRVERLAAQAHMSPRNFARIFTKDTGVTPGRFVERIRVEAARRRLEESGDTLAKIAADCGFGSLLSLRRSFRRVVGAAPAEYRERFSDIV